MRYLDCFLAEAGAGEKGRGLLTGRTGLGQASPMAFNISICSTQANSSAANHLFALLSITLTHYPG